MKFGPVAAAAARSAILAHGTEVAGQRWKKGRVLSSDDVAKLVADNIAEVVVAQLEPDDIGEDPAADQLANAIAGRGIRIGSAFTGRANLFATEPGVLVIDQTNLNAINAVVEDLTVATLAPYSVVNVGQMIATVKVIPFALPRADLDACLTLAAQSLLRVAPVKRARVGLVQTLLGTEKTTVLEKTRRVLQARLDGFGAQVAAELHCKHQVAPLAMALQALRDENCDLLLVAGASAIVDRRDVIPAAIETLGGQITHYGMPVDPGNLLLLGDWDGTPVVGLPGCARSPSYNGLDLVLPRLAADLPIKSADIMALGVGGLLKDTGARGAPRQAPVQAPARAAKIAALVLAAGQSRRMGKINKLLVDIEGEPMLRRVVAQVLQAPVEKVIVVVGFQDEAARAALAGLDVELVFNPTYGQGISASLRTGLAALAGADPVDGAVVVLADMPDLSSSHLKRLIAAFDPIEGRSICVPTYRGKRGNPVLWSRQFFAEMVELTGDSGAKHLLGEHAQVVCEVAMDDSGVLIDIDSPQALAAWRQ